MSDSTASATERQTWLFTRAEGSICIVRVPLGYGRVRLLIRGPGYLVTDLRFPDVAACMAHRAEFEQSILAEGYVPTADRRSGQQRPDAASGPDRRAPLDI